MNEPSDIGKWFQGEVDVDQNNLTRTLYMPWAGLGLWVSWEWVITDQTMELFSSLFHDLYPLGFFMKYNTLWSNTFEKHFHSSLIDNLHEIWNILIYKKIPEKINLFIFNIMVT